MKNSYILLVALFVVNGAIGQSSIPALLYNASTKSNHLEFDLKHQTLNSMEYVQSMMRNKEWEASSIFVEKNSREPIYHRTPDQRELIQIYDSSYDWQWDTLSIGWKISTKTTNMVYDVKNNLTSYMEKIWNGSSWLDSLKCSYAYDANNNLTSKSFQFWDGSEWWNSYRYFYIYDANNNQTSKSYQLWDGSNWGNSFQWVYTYDSHNNQTSTLWQQWVGGAWENMETSTFTYDDKNNLIIELTQIWNGTAWENSLFDTLIYDAKNNLTSQLFKVWNGVWVNKYLYTDTYDANYNPISVLGQKWNGNIWENYSLYTRTFDAKNNHISMLWQKWNGNAWINYMYSTNTYDDNSFSVSYSYKYWNYAGTKVTAGDSTYYYFHTVGINDLTLPLESITVYPNPLSGKITIQTTTIGYLSILNLNGQQLLQQEITEPTTTIDVSGLPSGVYVVKLVGEKGVQVGKFIKQ